MGNSLINDLAAVILAKYSIVYIRSWEEDRVINLLSLIAEKQFSKPMKLFIWSNSDGAQYNNKNIVGKNGPVLSCNQFLDYAINFEGNAIFLAKDLHVFWNDPIVRRKTRDLYDKFRSNHKTLFILSNQLEIHPELSKEISLFEIPLPDYMELRQVFYSVLKDFKEKRKVKVSVSEEDSNAFIRGVMGLTLDEAKRAFNKAFMETDHIQRSLVPEVLKEKKFLIDKAPGLIYVPDNFSLNQVGGLQNLKDWLNERIKCFTPEAKKYKIIPPKGLLITGISGCGKSFIVKGIAGLWDMPLVRLDMNQIYSVGNSPGHNFENALKTIEAIAPALLWIDEVEKAMGSDSDQGGEATRIFGAFLTWMQEKTSPVFVVATANKIDLLPAEMLRKGRFDEVFFVDLPTSEERESIFRLHMLNRNLEPSDFDLHSLVASTDGYSGSELEQVVVSAVFKGFMRGGKATQDDFYKVISVTIPMSVTMNEDVKHLKRWASQRAVFAGRSETVKEE